MLVTAGCHHVRRSPSTAGAIDGPVRLQRAPQTEVERALPLTFWSELISGEETLAIHVLRIDLHDSRLEIAAIVADDPDGEGPAEAALTDPLVLARRYRVLAAINANAFAGLPDSTGRRDTRWREGLVVDIAGLAVHGTATRSAADGHTAVDACFGIDQGGRPYIGPAPGGGVLREAVNGWWYQLVDHGRPVPAPGGDRHPRSAVGFDTSARWLYLVVVDGRQPGFSVGMTPRELADLMVRLGTDRALNLDGGGSSILLVGGDDEPQIVNRPSGGQPRPVPVLLAVRRRGLP